MAYKYTLPVGFVLKGGENEYVIEQVLGKGGFGVTYKVKATVLVKNIPFDLHFAVKEYFPNICSREDDNATMKVPETMQEEIRDGLQDFINEGERLQMVCKLNPNIVNVNEVFQANGTAYYVLEYLEGGDLRKMVKNNGKPLTEQQMLDVMAPIGRAVQCLHDNRMLHLDIKPDNIVMRRNNKGNDEPVLIDFGIAVHFRSDGTPTSKTPSQGISPGYSPIEQYSPVKKFDPRIDVYAFAATCLYLLTGKDPIEATDMPQDFVKNELPQGVSANVAAAIERGMTMNKNARIGSISEFLSLLTGETVKSYKKEIQPISHKSSQDNDTRQINAPINTPLKPKTSPKKTDPKRTKKLLIILSIVLAVALIAGIVLLSKRCSTKVGIDDRGMNSSNIERRSGADTIRSEDVIIETALEQTFNVDDVLFTMVKVEGGTFTMGATREQGSDAEDGEKPAHEVTLSSYYIGQTEVTQELWKAVMGSNPSQFKGAKRPVEAVSWDDCQEFIRKLNQMTGKNFRLPTEAEWEYAARGGNRSKHFKYSGSNNIDDVAWFYYNSGGKSHDVATKRANELGIYDMSGNVYEWCQDKWYDYGSSPNEDGSVRVNRGGCWVHDAKCCRVSFRGCWIPDDCENVIFGLRLAL